MNLVYTSSTDIEKAYIITLNGNTISEQHSAECQKSCLSVNMPFEVWDAYDGTNGGIVVPAKLQNESIANMVKITNLYLSTTEIACILSHLSLWIHCAVINKPIVILEHDAIMTRRLVFLDSYNAIVYLGGAEWKSSIMPVYPIPPFGTDEGNPNTQFLLRAHAYAIDPPVAKNLIAHILQMGIYTSADCFMRANLFNITHQGFYAYDKHNNIVDDVSTIQRRPGGTAPILNTDFF